MTRLEPTPRARMDEAQVARHREIAERTDRFLELLLAGDAARALAAAPWTLAAEVADGQCSVMFVDVQAEGAIAGIGDSPLEALQRAVAAWPALRERLEQHARIRAAERELRLFHLATHAEAIG